MITEEEEPTIVPQSGVQVGRPVSGGLCSVLHFRADLWGSGFGLDLSGKQTLLTGPL